MPILLVNFLLNLGRNRWLRYVVVMLVMWTVASIGGDSREVTVGVVVEGVMNINRHHMQSMMGELNGQVEKATEEDGSDDIFGEKQRLPRVRLVVNSQLSTGADAFKTIQRVCDMIHDGVSALVSLTSCSTSIPLRHLTNNLNVPHVVLPPTTNCQCNPTSASTEISLSPNYDAVIKLISLIAQKRNWSHLTVFFDDLFHEDLVERIRDEIKADLSREHTSVQGRRAKSDRLKVHCEKIFDMSRQSDFTKSRLKGIQLRSQSTEFLILANEQNTLKLLQLAETIGFAGEHLHWIIGNYNLESSALFQISNSTNVIAISRQNSLLSFAESQWLSVNPDLRPGHPFNRHPSAQLDYIRDSVLAVTLATQRALSKHPNMHISSDKDHLSCFSQNSDTFLSGSLIREAFLPFHSRPLIGHSGSLSLLKNSNTLSEYYPEPFSLNVEPNLNLYSNGPSWKLIYQYDSSSKQWSNTTPVEDHNGGFFPPKLNTLKGLTLKIVTVEEEPFIIRSKKSSLDGRDVWSGYCIDILEAIRRHNSIDSPFDYDIYPVNSKIDLLHSVSMNRPVSKSF